LAFVFILNRSLQTNSEHGQLGQRQLMVGAATDVTDTTWSNGSSSGRGAARGRSDQPAENDEVRT
jgi:hypothetical protein